MKLKTNKLLTLTLASSLVAITAGCGGTKAAAPTGTTPVVVPEPTTYTEWSEGVTIAADATENAFLAGVAAIAGTGGAADTPVTLTGVPTNTTVETLSLAYEVTPVSATSGATKGLNAETFGGAATNGVAFAATTGATPADARFVAGLIAGADVGVPLTSTTAAGTWNGIFQAVGANAVERDFELDVDFTNSQISAIIPLTGDDASAAGIMSYFFVGQFDAGVITGDIIFGDFSAAADAAAALTAAGNALTAGVATGAVSPASDGVGTLSGLIGANGALGAFYSTANGALGYAGGFVALTAANVGGDDPDVVYADWSGSATLVEAITENGFVAGSAAGLELAAITATAETLDLADEAHPEVPAEIGTAGVGARTLGTNATSGVAFTSMGTGDDTRYFAGLHSGTDLGAPVATTGGEATWNGLIQAVSGTPASAFAEKIFTLTVNFGTTDATRTISAHVAAAADFTTTSYYLAGTYDENGVITGTVSSGVIAAADTATATANGTLTGLIGATGAVGAFHSTGTGATGYAGGFVAIPTAIPAGAVLTALVAPVVEYTDWTAGATQATALGTANGFLAGTATSIALVPQGVTAASVRDGSATGAITGGVSFFNNPGTTPATDARYYAGLHSDTNLGAPIPLTTANTAMWSGMFETVSGTAGQQVAEKAITLAVTFGASPTITGSVAVGSTVDGNPAYHINGQYDAAGVITGFVAYNASATDSATGVGLAITGGGAGTGTLTGLIGASGAVGAFHSSGSDGNGATGYAGGFYVKP